METKSGTLRLAMGGQSLIEHQIDPHDQNGWKELESILKAADVAFTNLETTIKGKRESWPMKPLDWCTRPDASCLDLLRSLGFNLMSLVNNHSWDLGPHGVLDTIEEVEKRGFVHAGTGVDLEDAEQPAFIETSFGRVALIAMASGNLPAPSSATARRDDGDLARPGVNPVEVRDVHLVPSVEFDHLIRVFGALGYAPDHDDTIIIGEERFKRGEIFALSREIEQNDKERHFNIIRSASREADMVIVYVHQHHWEREWQAVGPWLQNFAHECIDAGAHIFLGHGVPMLQPLEIYKSKPVFYSLGNFIFHPTAGPSYWPDKRCWQSVIVEASFADGEWKDLTLRPISLGTEESVIGGDLEHLSRRYPLLAKGPYGEQILKDFAALCEPFGTKIDIYKDLAKVILQ